MIEEKVFQSNGNRYLGEFMEDLPDNVMLNKVITGCGMTSLVLENEVKYVLAVPFVSLIKNKKQWCKEKGIELCTVYSKGANEKEITVFAGNKIITTYDSLGKVTDLLEARGDLKEWKICVDESHKLVDTAAFRPKAIKNVLDNYLRYNGFVFGTATPIDDKNQLPLLSSIQKARIVWDNLEPVKVNFTHYDSKINDVTATLAIEFFKGERDGNAHIFLNSVRSICSIIKKCKRGGFDLSKDIRIVCSDNSSNQSLIDRQLSGDYFISPVNSKVRKVNFYTATAFEGCDIYDEFGKSFIVTDGQKDHTKIDIVTVLPQIIGRIRNTKYNNTIDLLYTKNQYLCDISEADFRKQVLRNISIAKNDVKIYDSLMDEETNIREALVKYESPYLLVDGDELIVNEAAMYNEMHNFSTLRKTYYVSRNGEENGISNATKNFNGINYQYQELDRIEIKGLNKVRLGRASNFKDLCIDFLNLKKEKPSTLRSAKLIELKKIEPLINQAYNVLGEQKIIALRFRKTEIKLALLTINNGVSKDFKIVKLLGLNTGKWISRFDAKALIQEAYKNLGLKITAKATDLSKWYHIENKRKRVDGTLLSGIVIKGCKVKLSN